MFIHHTADSDKSFYICAGDIATQLKFLFMRIDFDFKLPESVDSEFTTLHGISVNSVRFLLAFVDQYGDFLNKRGSISSDELRFLNELKVFRSSNFNIF